MEATSPASTAPEPAAKARDAECRSPVRKTPPAFEHAPDVTVPLSFMLLGLVSFVVATVWLAFRSDLLVAYHYGPHVIALTHLVVLGFISSVVMGAVYQLAPVALETRLHSERLARIHFWCHLVGVPGMVAMFWIWDMKQVGHFGTFFGLGIGLFAWNIARTLRRARRWNAVAYGIASSTAWLVLTMLAGLFLASAKCWPRINPLDPLGGLHAHAHLGVLGCFVILIVAVSYRLVPMFLLSAIQSERRARWSVHLLNCGVAGLVTTVALKSPWKLAFAFLVVAGLVVYAIELTAILAVRKRRSLDWGLRSFFSSMFILGVLAVLGAVLCWPTLPANEFTTRLENVYGFLALYGFVGWAILGMLYKILPFLVWYRAYAAEIGRSRVPVLHEMYSHPLQAVGYWTYTIGLAATALAMATGSEPLVQAGWLLLVAGVAVFLVNAGRILRHLVRPQLRPLLSAPKRAAA